MMRVETSGWVRSSRCVSGDCVEAARAGSVVLVRDSKRGPAGVIQAWSVEEWRDLLKAVRTGGPAVNHVAVDVLSDGTVWFGLRRMELLEVSWGDWAAFTAGVLAGEFDVKRLPLPQVPAAGAGVADSGILTPAASAFAASAPAAAHSSPAGRPDVSTGCANDSVAGQPGSRVGVR